MNRDVKVKYDIFRKDLYNKNDSILNFNIYLSSFLPSQKMMCVLLETDYTEYELENLSNEIYNILKFKNITI